MTLQNSGVVTQSDEINLEDFWAALRQRARFIAASTVLFGTLAAGISLLMTPIFKAQVTLSVSDSGSAKGGGVGALAGQFGGLASLAGVSIGGSSDRSEAIGTLKSWKLAETFIATQKLLPVLYADAWDTEKGTWKSNLAEPPTLWFGTGKFVNEIRTVEEDKKSGLITVTVEWEDPEQAARWATELVRLANKSLREQAIKRSEGNLAYLHAQLDETIIVELRQAIYRLIENEVKSVMVAQGSEEYAFRVVDPAVVPEKKVRPKRAVITIIGLLFGFMASAMFAISKVATPRPTSA
jgi:uncharacterized protein involved in exopolysaccharide biosynthesis